MSLDAAFGRISSAFIFAANPSDCAIVRTGMLNASQKRMNRAAFRTPHGQSFPSSSVTVPSGSAEAFLLIPMIVPLASAFGVSSQLCVVAFAFGDGFSNIIYPTNAALLVSLGLAGCSYGKWVKYSLSFQLLNLALTSGLLLLGVAVGYA